MTLLVLVIALAAADGALACHPCVVGEPCPPHGGCGGGPPDFDFARPIVLTITAGGTSDGTRWRLHVRPSLIQLLSVGDVHLSGRGRCRGTLCVGRRGRVGGLSRIGGSFLLQSRFRSGARCEFAGSIANEASLNRYRCVDAQGRFDSEGSFDVTADPVGR